MTEGAFAAGEEDDLHPPGGLTEKRRHGIEPGVVRIDERIVEDERHRGATILQQIGKGQPSEDCELLLRAPAISVTRIQRR